MLAECLIVVGSILLADSAADEGDEIPVASLNFDWKIYEKPVARRYSVARKEAEGQLGEVEGFLVSSTKIDGESVVLLDEMIDKTTQGDRKFREVLEQCEMDALLTPLRLEVRGFPTDGPPREATATVQSGKVSARLQNGATRNYDLRPDSITRSALLRIIGQLPREAGRKYRFSNLFESDVHEYSDGPLVIECVGPESIELAGNAVECFKFVLRDEIGGFDDEFWVDEEGVLQRIVSNGRDVFELVGEEQAAP